MKKLLLKLLTLVLLSCSALCIFTACNGGADEDDGGITPPPEHTCEFNEQVTTETYKKSDATCTEQAVYYYSCDCGEKGTLTFTYGEALGHEFTDYTSDNNATCDEDGTKTATCNRADCNETDSIRDVGTALGHEFIDYVSDNNAMCLVDGTKTAICNHTGCNETDTVTDIGTALDHEFSNYISDNNATCLVDGTKTATCNHTGCNETDSILEQVDHAYENGKCKWCKKEQESVGLSYALINNGVEYAVTGMGDCTDNEIVIPSAYENIPVTTIGSSAFRECTSLTSIVLPNSITSIAEKAFYDCSSLVSVQIPNSVTSIGASAFYRCTSLENVTFKKDSKLIGIENAVFYNCTSLIGIEIPNSVTSIGNSAFSWCASLENVIFEKDSKLTSMGDYAFMRCTSLLGMETPNSVTSIGVSAFDSCSSLLSVTIPTNLTWIKDNVFSGCTSLLDVEIPSSVKSIGESAFSSCISLETIVIPDSVTFIGSSAFKNCRSLKYITFPDIELKKYSLLDGCQALTSIYYSGTIEKWIANDFGNRLNIPAKFDLYIKGELLTDVNISGISSIPQYAFYNCSSIKSITISNSISTIGERAFRCPSLEAVNFLGTLNQWISKGWGDKFSKYNLYIDGNAVTNINISNISTIPSYSFYNCISLTSVGISSSVTNIDKGAFGECSSLKSITLPFVGATLNGTSKTHFSYIFDYSGSKRAESVPSSLETVIVTGGTSIGSEAFINCATLTNIELPNGLISIGEKAFYGCTTLNSMIVPKSVTNIGKQALYMCKSLESLTIPFIGESEDSERDWFGHLFSGSDVSGMAVSYVMGANSYVPVSLKTVEITGAVQIKAMAFAGCGYIKEIKISTEALTAIPIETFYNCTSLISIKLPDSISSISNSAFYGCTSLQNVTFGEDSQLTSIGTNVFYNCTSLERIEIPDGVTNIGDSAFKGCTSLVSVKLPSDIASISMRMFETCTSLKNITIPNSVTVIYGSAFKDCKSLENIEIPNSVTSIVGSAFAGCISLQNVIFEENNQLTSIGYNAFKDCASLISITIPMSVTNIDDYAFTGCNSLTICCEVETLPEGWSSYWNSSNRPVVWGYKGN